MADGLDIVAIGVQNEGAVIVAVVFGPGSGATIVAPACGHGGPVEGVHLGAGAGGEGDVLRL